MSVALALVVFLVAACAQGALAGGWEWDRIRTARELLAAGLLRSSYTMHADIVSRSRDAAARAASLEVMAAIAWKYGKNGLAKELLDRSDMERGGRPEATRRPRQSESDPPPPHAGHGDTVRVLLARGGSFSIKLTAPCIGSRGRGLDRGKHAVGVLQGGLIVDGAPADALLCAPGDGTFEHGGRLYAGAVSLGVEDGEALLVNYVPLETYLRGVVPAEMPAGWDLDALKAQAVAARTYALRKMRQRSYAAYDLVDDERDQVYIGIDGSTAESDRAVAETGGRILVHDGEPILAMYHAHSGGRLEAASLDSHPYLRGGSDAESTELWTGDWEVRLPLPRVAQRVGGRVLDITAPQRTPGGRVESFQVRTDAGIRELSCRDVSAMLSPKRLPSRLCDARLVGDELVLSGTGFGHGMGMSQWGARAMARQGHSYVAILGRYYPGAQLVESLR